MSEEFQLPTLRTFLKDPIFRKWMAQSPALSPLQRQGKAWWVYVQKKEDGPWSRAGVSSYADGYKWIGQRLKKFHDFALVSKRRAYLPPVYRPVINGRTARNKVYWAEYPRYMNWCPYCRRPTLFEYFTSHHADTVRRTFGDYTPRSKRCSICGISEDGAGPWMYLGHNGKLPDEMTKVVKV